MSDARGMDAMIAAARGGDGEILGALLESHRGYLRVLARIELGRGLQAKVDASDIVQEAFLHAHRQFGGFRGAGRVQLAAWLREILAGTLAGVVRRYLGTKARDPRLEETLAGSLDHSAAGLGGLVAAAGASPSEHAIRNEQTLRVAAALCELPEEHQQVILLRHLEGLPFAEIAARMGRSVDSVEKLWVRGLTGLRRALGQAG
jgi:RNA polymerase sigma-70 factor (ECF subfamily)